MGCSIEEWNDGALIRLRYNGHDTFRWISWEMAVKGGNDFIIDTINDMERELMDD